MSDAIFGEPCTMSSSLDDTLDELLHRLISSSSMLMMQKSTASRIDLTVFERANLQLMSCDNVKGVNVGGGL